MAAISNCIHFRSEEPGLALVAPRRRFLGGTALVEEVVVGATVVGLLWSKAPAAQDGADTVGIGTCRLDRFCPGSCWAGSAAEVAGWTPAASRIPHSESRTMACCFTNAA